MKLILGKPNPKQKAAMQCTKKHICFGGARGGGKSWLVRVKAILLSLNFPGTRILIVRRTYPELMNNHIMPLRSILLGVAVYHDRDKRFTFKNGSSIQFTYCDSDKDLLRLQGQEYDVIFLDEATQLSEYQMKAITACVRGVNSFPKRIYYTCNPGGQGHAYIKRLFIDSRFEAGEDPDDYAFFQAYVWDNEALMAADAEYVKQLEALPTKLRAAWLEGRWDIFEGMYFEDFRPEPSSDAVLQTGLSKEELSLERRWCHVIEPFAPPMSWKYYRSYDWGYGKPFSCNWWAVDPDGVAYMIAELYGCTGEPDVGVKWNNEKQFSEIARIEREHPYLKGRRFIGVADPSIWDGSKGVSAADTAQKHGIFFSPGVNDRIPGWMQMHYRFAFDAEGYARMYFFNTCRDTVRTLPTLMFDEHIPEDLDTKGEDHAADSIRYFCMARPISPPIAAEEKPIMFDPLDITKTKRRDRVIIYR